MHYGIEPVKKEAPSNRNGNDDLAEIAAALRARRIGRLFRLADRHRREIDEQRP